MEKTKRKPIEIGEKIGRLTVIKCVGKKDNGAKIYQCVCDCGNFKEVLGVELRREHTRSCGCLFKDVQLKTVSKHGQRYTRLYSIWKDIKKRCNNPKSAHFNSYGGRGIKVCDEWANEFHPFYEWAMANGYSDELSIDRKNVNGNYEPSNCRWATMKEQANNKRNSVFIEHNGETHTVAEWSEILDIKRTTIYSRLQRGVPKEKVLEKEIE